MTWFGYTLLSVFFSAVLGILLRVLSVKSTNVRAFSFVFNACASVIAVMLFLPQALNQSLTLSPILLALIGTSALLYGIFERSQFYARKYIEASTFSVLASLNPIITFAGSIIILSESITLSKAIGSVLIIGASIVLSFKKGVFKPERSWLYMILPMTAIGLARVFDKVVSESFPVEIYNVILWSLPLIAIYFPSIPFKDLKKELEISVWKIAVAAFANVLTFYYLLKAFSLGEASNIVMISASSTILVVIAGIVILKERSRLFQKLLAGVIVVIGIILLR